MTDYNKVRTGRQKMARKMVQEISRSPAMSAEQGPSWLAAWGGPANYQQLARIRSGDDRAVYTAVSVDGLGNVSEIAQATGMSEAQVNAALNRLNKAGYTTIQAEPLEL